MPRVEIPAPADIVQDAQGNALSGRSVTLKLAGTATDATHYSALTGGTSTTGGLTTGTDGTIRDGSGNRRYVDSGAALDVTVGGATRRVEPLSASVERSVPYVNLGVYADRDASTSAQQAGWDSAVSDLAEGGTLFIPGDGKFQIPLPVCEKRIDIIGEGPGSAIEISAGALADGFIYGPASTTAVYGSTLRNFSIIGGASAARYAVVLRRLIECTIEDVYVKAGATWHVSIEGLLVCKVRMRMPGNNFLLPYTATRGTNGVRVVGSAGAGTDYPSNANDLDFVIEAITGDGLVVDATVGDPGSFNNEIRGCYQGITGKPIHVKGAQHWKISRTHVEASGTVTIEDCGPAEIGRGSYLGTDVDLIDSNDIELDGVSCDLLTIDSDSERIKLGRITYNLLSGGPIADHGIGTVSDGRLVNAGGVTKSRGLPGPQESMNLLRSDGIRRWDIAGPKPLGATITAGTITKAGDGQADTRKLYSPFSGLMSGASATYLESAPADALEEAKGNYVTIGAWVYIASGQPNQPNVVIEANLASVSTYTGDAVSATDAWQLITITVPVDAATTQLNLKLRNTVASTGDWYIAGTFCVLGRVAPRTRALPKRYTLYGEDTWDPASTADAAVANKNVTVQGAALGDVCRCSFSLGTGNGVMFTARVVSANTTQVTMFNKSGAPLDLASGTVRVEVEKWV